MTEGKTASRPAGPPPNYDPIVNGLWKPPVEPTEAEIAAAKAARDAAAASPAPRNPSEAAWNAWRAAGGYTDNLPARGWLDRLNARAY
jgi:hypothetical protein